MEASGNLDALVERVLERARGEAAAIVERAGKAAERRIGQAGEECRRRHATLEASLREAADRRRHSLQAEVRQLEQREVMNAEESAVEEVFAAALRELARIENPAARRELLERLVEAGVRALGSKTVKVRFNAAELELARASGFPDRIDGVAVKIDDDTVNAGGGPVVSDATGRVIFENTFEARLDRARERLRRLAAEALGLLEQEGDR